MIIFLYYHRMDLDGYLGGYVLKKHFMDQGCKIVTPKNDFVLEHAVKEAQTDEFNNLTFVRPYNYGDSLAQDIEALTSLKDRGEIVGAIFVDCCPYGKENYFQKLYDLTAKGRYLTIIDHHKTALKFIEEFENENKTAIPGLRSIDYAACELAWLYIKACGESIKLGNAGFISHKSRINSVDEEMQRAALLHMPLVLKFAGMYDTFRKDNKWPLVLAFQYGLRTVVPDLLNLDENPDINHLLSETLTKDGEISKDLVNELMTKGNGILDYLKGRNSKIMSQYGHILDTEFLSALSGEPQKIKCKCHWVTDYLNNSSVFSDNPCMYKDPDLVYMIISPDLFAGTYKVTLYSIDTSEIDVSKIAEVMGGGGHFHAAGFTATSAFTYKINEQERGLQINFFRQDK
jgi:hypothetical protein